MVSLLGQGRTRLLSALWFEPFLAAGARRALEYLGGINDRPTGLEASRHIYVHMKSDYYEINDGLPQFSEEYTSYFAEDFE